MKKNTFLKKTILSLLLILNTTGLFSLSLSYDKVFKLDPVKDGLELGFGGLLSGSALVCDKIFPIKTKVYNPADWQKKDIPELDMLFARPYSKPLHIIGSGTCALALLSPAMFAFLPQSEWLTVGLMYTETLLFANGIKEWIKLLVYKARPYMYFEGYPTDKLADGDWSCSFPSGHTTLAFAGASFTTMLFCNYFPESKWKFAVAGGSFGIAALTGALRMGSGNHFFSDVIAGAFIGTLCGIAIPYLHTKRQGHSSLSVSPVGVNLSFAL